MCLLNMQGVGLGVLGGGGVTSQISGYYSAASLINQSSLCSGAVDNTKGDANAIESKEGRWWYLGMGGGGVESLVFEIFTIRTFLNISSE